jgi:hypothetical protein
VLPLGGTRMALVHATLVSLDRSVSIIRRIQVHDRTLGKAQLS